VIIGNVSVNLRNFQQLSNDCQIPVSVDSLASQVPVSSLQSVMTSSQAGRSQGPNLTPSLANYCRADLIGHITGWPADMLEKQVIEI
jgi:hypothetical protein